MRNYLRNDSLSKNNTNTKNSNFYDNSINSSNILTANHFYQLKELNNTSYLFFFIAIVMKKFVEQILHWNIIHYIINCTHNSNDKYNSNGNK